MRTAQRVLFLSLVIAFPACGAGGDILSVTIPDSGDSLGTSGWYADVVVEGAQDGGTYDWGFTGDNDPTGANFRLLVTSPGFDTAGDVTTVTREVYGTIVLRQPYPNQATMWETEDGGNVTLRVALSDYVYYADTATVEIDAGWYTATGPVATNAYSGTVVNNSDLTYPKVIGRWAMVPFDIVQDDFLLEMVAFHRFARNGQQVACVKFEAEDESANTSPDVTVTEATVSSKPDPNAVIVSAFAGSTGPAQGRQRSARGQPG